MTAGPKTILEMLWQQADRQGDAPAIVDVAGRSISFVELSSRVDGLARAIRARGMGPDDVVMVGAPNGPDTLIGIIAAMCAGVCAPMNLAYTQEELVRLAEDTGAAAVLAPRRAEGRLASLVEATGLPLIEGGEAATGGSPVEPMTNARALLLHTAGTTARPKQVPLSHANLMAASQNVVASLALRPADRCLNVMPLFHSHGLLGAALSSLTAGSSIVCAPAMDPRRFLGWAQELRCTWYTAAPTIHRLVLDAPGEWSGCRLMRSASAPLPPQLADGLERRFGAPMIEVYGMTEAYQIAANPLPPAERRRGTVGRPTGTEVAVVVDGGEPQTTTGPNVVGEIVVRGAAVFAGYSWPSHANEAAFIDGWFRTGDVGSISNDGYVSITGRLKEQINRGGEKISPREVEESLLDHPSVREAMAFAIPDPLLGEELGVAVVIRKGTHLDLRAVREFLSDRVAPFKVPRQLVIVDEIPKSDTGKPRRITFATEHGIERTGPSASAIAEGASVIERLASIWRDVLELNRLPGPSERFFDLGGTSLAAMELVVRIEAEFGLDLPVLDVLEVPELGSLASHLELLSDGRNSPGLLRCYRPSSSGSNLVLVPGQMGMAIGLNLIADAITADVSIHLFDYPGHRGDEQPLSSIESLADALVGEILRHGCDDQLAIYGNSMGGWVALEAARRLEGMGKTPRLVGIGDMYSPFFNTRASPLRPPFHRRLRNRIRRVIDRIRQRTTATGPTTVPVPLAVRRQRSVSNASEFARRSYRPQPYGGRVLVVSASERTPKYGPTLGYERHVTGRIDTLRVEGGHSEMHRDQAEPIARALSARLAEIGLD